MVPRPSTSMAASVARTRTGVSRGRQFFAQARVVSNPPTKRISSTPGSTLASVMARAAMTAASIENGSATAPSTHGLRRTRARGRSNTATSLAPA